MRISNILAETIKGITPHDGVFLLSMRRVLIAVFACTILGGCASSAHQDRAQLLAPTAVSNVYSYADMQLLLATIPDSDDGCTESACVKRAEFDRRVTLAGALLAEATYRSDPELAKRVPRFDFSVLDKEEPGTASTAGGDVVVLRPVSAIAPADAALSFVLAREIGHVALEHHEQNTAISLVVSVLTSVLAPVVNVTKLLAVVYSGATSTAATASVTAASFAGSRAVIESYRPQRLQEADAFAMRLLARFGYDARDVTAGFAQADLQSPTNEWMRGLQASVRRLAAHAERPELAQAAQHPASMDAVAAAK